jgi:hypothetical protein
MFLSQHQQTLNELLNVDQHISVAAQLVSNIKIHAQKNNLILLDIILIIQQYNIGSSKIILVHHK